jgi:hypothetical protein
MDNSNQYVIEYNGVNLYYYKNNKLHREVGPAIFSVEDMDSYYKLGDEDLYVMKYVNPKKSTAKKQYTPGYCLDNLQYNKDGFEFALKQKNIERLHNNLSNQLSTNDNQSKKIKI